MSQQSVNAVAQGRIDILIDFLGNIGKMDFDRAAVHLDPDVRLELPFMANWPPAEGKAALIQQLSTMLPLIAEYMDFTIKAWYPTLDPDVVIAEYHSYCPLKSGAGVYENDYISVFRFKDDKIVLYREYLNPDKINFEF